MKTDTWIEDFIKCFDVPDNKDLQIEKGFLIKDRNIPRSLFKFRAVNDFSLNNLEEETVWLNSPSNYNDPYDSTASISSREIYNMSIRNRLKDIPSFDKLYDIIPQQEIERVSQLDNPAREINRLILESHPEISPERIPEMLDAFDSAFQKVLEPAHTQLLQHIRSSLKICSFAATMSPIVMWSHYADQHKGMCIEYDLSGVQSGELQRRMLFPVIYSDNMFDCTKYHVGALQRLEGFNNIYAQIQALYKSPEWTYEHEWRLVFAGGIISEECNYPWLPAACVYLGTKVTDSDRKRVLDVCNAKAIPVKQMRLKPDCFELEAI